MRAFLNFLMAAALCGCASRPPAAPEDVFFARLQALCGRTFVGRLVTTDKADADMQGRTLVMRVAECGPQAIRIPFAVGEDHSRTWVITRTAAGLRLKHDHRHADGTPDVRTDYGGDSRPPVTAERIEFPADEASKAMFVAQGIPQSATNVWALELKPGRLFAYELRREGRYFRVEFDLNPRVVLTGSSG